MIVKALYENEWVSLMIMRDPERGVHGYVYSHETRCQGKIVVVLPYRIKMGRKAVGEIAGITQYRATPSITFLLRKEVTPCWGMEPKLSSITGGVEVIQEKEVTTRMTAKQELWEEAGYDVYQTEMFDLGTVFGTKSSDTVYHLYAVDLTKKKKTGKAKGDGSELEAMAECVWVNEQGLYNARDPMVFAAFHRLRALGKLNV